MKKIVTVAFSILLLCSMLIVTAGTATAGNAAYSILEYWASTPVTVDGNWTVAAEWTDAPRMNMSNTYTAGCKYKMDTSVNYAMLWLTEVFDDNTNDAGDIWQICIDPANSGGAAPASTHFKIEILGHTTMKAYQGNGTGWSEITLPAGEVSWANSISASPWNSTPHWVIEFSENDKQTGTITVGQPPNAFRIAYYDASNPAAGWRSWAPGSADVPDTWGVVSTYSSTPYPEPFSIVFVALLSIVAVAVGFYFARKHPKTSLAKNYAL